MSLSGLSRSLWAGLAGGAAGTAALNTATYLDMAWRGRGASSAPEKVVERIADRAGIDIPGDGEERANRVSGLGALSGIAACLGVGVVLAAMRAAGAKPGVLISATIAGAGAMLASDGSIAALRVSDLRTWSRADWLSDIVPHAVYGVLTALVVRSIDQR